MNPKDALEMAGKISETLAPDLTAQARQAFQRLLADSIVDIDAAAIADKFPPLRYDPTDSGEQALTNLLNMGENIFREIGGGTSAAAPSVRLGFQSHPLGLEGLVGSGLPKIGFTENLSGAEHLVDAAAAPAAAVERGVPDVIANATPAETAVGRAMFDAIPDLGWSPAELAAKEERETALAALYRPGAPYLR